MQKLGRNFLEATNGGLEIFKKYLEHQFEVNKLVYVQDRRFIVLWNKTYNNYAIYVDQLINNEWTNIHRLNAIWYVKELFGISEHEVYLKVNTDLNLSLIEVNPEDVNVERKFINL